MVSGKVTLTWVNLNTGGDTLKFPDPAAPAVGVTVSWKVPVAVAPKLMTVSISDGVQLVAFWPWLQNPLELVSILIPVPLPPDRERVPQVPRLLPTIFTATAPSFVRNCPGVPVPDRWEIWVMTGPAVTSKLACAIAELVGFPGP